MAASHPAEGMFVMRQTPSTVLCCLCGTPMAPNATGMCAACIRTNVDITEGLPKHLTVMYCPECSRWLQPPRAWIKAEPESKELLTFCLKKMKNLSKVKLVDASFIWTEPHSKRIKMKVTIQKEVQAGAVLQQTFVAEYVVEDHYCDACTRAAANPDQWTAVVQVRQKVTHKRTFLFLEQLILKHGADAQTVNIRSATDGVDFFFANRSHAQKFVDFVSSVVPVQYRHDKQLVSHDSHSNAYRHKFSFSVEICPVCKDDLICLPQKVATALGGPGPLVLCSRVSNSLSLLDPNTLQTAHLDATQYWRYSFKPLLTSRQLVEYVVLDIDVVGGSFHQGSSQASPQNSKFVLAEAQVARVTDFGRNDLMFTTRTHLGHLLRPGDRALGYDIAGANINSDDFSAAFDRATRAKVLPDVVLVRKSYEAARKKRRGKPRGWKLKSLGIVAGEDEEMVGGGGGRGRGGGEEEKEALDRERFLDEIEEDADVRSRILVFKDEGVGAGRPRGAGGEVDMTEEGGEEEEGSEPPEIPLEDLLSDLRLDETFEAASGGDVDDMEH